MLDNKTVETYLMELGFDDIKSFQKAYMYPKYVDGIYGQQTENALLSAINVKRYTKNFDLKEFRCECGGRYCCGYPSVMKPEVLRNIQSIRDHWNRPVTITCGLRDKTYNSKLGGSIQNSLHLSGQAIDFYQAGVTDTLAHRKSSIKWIKTLPNHHYTYGNGINSYGNGVSAPYMGNALHTDAVYKAPAPSPVTPDGKLVCDGIGGNATVKAMQRFFGTTQDGFITQNSKSKSLKKYYPALTAVKFVKGGSSTCIKNMQKWLGITADGIWGRNTSIALQKKLGVTADGIFGKKSMKAWQKYLNENDKAVYPQPVAETPQQKACAWGKKIAKDNSWHYVKWSSNEKTHECPICKNHPKGKYHGWNCIGFAWACWRHGAGIKCKCNNHVIDNACAEKILKASNAEALKIVKEKSGLNDVKVIRNHGDAISQSKLKAGDICMNYKGNKYQHTFLYLGNGKMVDAQGSSGKISTNNQIKVRKVVSAKVAIRYTGK